MAKGRVNNGSRVASKRSVAVRWADSVQPSAIARTMLPAPVDLNNSRKGFFANTVRHAQVPSSTRQCTCIVLRHRVLWMYRNHCQDIF
jgi:hypothetical protein